MKRMQMTATVFLFLTVISTAFAVVKEKNPGDRHLVLNPGAYTAKVKSLPCGGCGSVVEKTMADNFAIGSVSVDSQKKTVAFTVKTGARVEWAALQKSLDAAAQQMGMGADYGLYDMKKVGEKSVPSKPTSQKLPLSEPIGRK